LDELNYQFLRRLQKEGLITWKELFNDGTKIEANGTAIRLYGEGRSIIILQDDWIRLIRCIRSIMY